MLNVVSHSVRGKNKQWTIKVINQESIPNNIFKVFSRFKSDKILIKSNILRNICANPERNACTSIAFILIG